jgi:hypothetical protein
VTALGSAGLRETSLAIYDLIAPFKALQDCLNQLLIQAKQQLTRVKTSTSYFLS